MEALFDSNILIDTLRKRPEGGNELRRYRRHFISRITWIEVLAGSDVELREPLLAFLSRFTVVELDADIAMIAADIRQRLRMKLPDAIILATAQRRSLVLVTRNAKDFPARMPGIRVPYTL